MQVQFLGATGTVTGSKYLVRHENVMVLVDCGLFQGYKQLRLRNRAPLPVHPRDIKAVILTHAHIDHSGYLPLLALNGFRGKVFCTPATEALCRVLLPDSGHLQEEEAAFANKHGFSRHHPALPLYTKADAERCLRLFRPVEQGGRWRPLPGLEAGLAASGHMLGSSFVRLADGARSILFSGDLGRPDDLLLKPPAARPEADYLVVESTYGDRLHRHGDVRAELADIICKTAARGGTLLIPAFAVGRAQALMHLVHLLRESNAIPPLRLYLDSPMAASATEIYQRFASEHRLTAAQCKAMAHTAHIVQTPQESQALGARPEPKIIIAASGMATGGRVVHHLKNMAPDRRNCILFTGFQAGGTRGATLMAGNRSVRIHGQDVPVRAQVAMLDSLSAHADAKEIIGWLRSAEQQPRQTFVTHGEPAASDALRQRVERELGWTCRVPEYQESAALT